MTDETPVMGTADDPIHVVTHPIEGHPTAREEATEANAVAVEAVTVAVTERAALAASMSEMAASSRDLAAAIQAQAEQAANEARAVAERAAATAKAVRRRQMISLLLLAVLLLAVLIGGVEGRSYINASNHRASVNGGTLQRLDANTAEIKRTNEKIDLYTTGQPAVDAQRATLQLVLCINAKTANLVRGDPIPVECAALGIK
jgi:hypothetical protein